MIFWKNLKLKSSRTLVWWRYNKICLRIFEILIIKSNSGNLVVQIMKWVVKNTIRKSRKYEAHKSRGKKKKANFYFKYFKQKVSKLSFNQYHHYLQPYRYFHQLSCSDCLVLVAQFQFKNHIAEILSIHVDCIGKEMK